VEADPVGDDDQRRGTQELPSVNLSRRRSSNFWGWKSSLRKEAVFERLKDSDWTFSATADVVVAALLAVAILVSVIALT
jgi:hypothetical protein